MRLTISIPSALKESVAEAAKRERRSVSNYATIILETFFAEKKAKQIKQRRAS